MSDFFHLLENCELCPRKCGVNRNAGEKGYCNSGAGFEIASVCIHRGEEPPISGEKGICNVFFPHCNMQCVFCQNHQISETGSMAYREYELNEVTGQIVAILEKGIHAVGFVSPTHYLPQAVAIINELRRRGYNPVTVWNSNGYDVPEMIGLLDDSIDIFMPDLKYANNRLAVELSDTSNYAETALAAIKTMKALRGARLLVDDNGHAYRGMLIRHLVLPGHAMQSCEVLERIAEEISSTVPVSLMSQYHPMHRAAMFPEINRPLTTNEYALVKEKMNALGLGGWIQETESAGLFLPDFGKCHPFE